MNVISFVIIMFSLLYLFNLNPLKLVYSSYIESYNSTTLYSKLNNKKISSFFKRNNETYSLMGKKNIYSIFISLSIISFIFGIILSFLLSNIFLLIPLPPLFAFIPLYIMDTLGNNRMKKIKSELENYLSIVTSSYIRTNNIISSFEENLKYIKLDELKAIFSSFIVSSRISKGGLVESLNDLKGKLPFSPFRNYIDNLIICNYDSHQKETLMSYILDMSNERKANDSLKEKTHSIMFEMLVMLTLLVLNYPIIYFLNKDWFTYLTTSVMGKAIISFTISFISLSYFFVSSKIKKVTSWRDET